MWEGGRGDLEKSRDDEFLINLRPTVIRFFEQPKIRLKSGVLVEDKPNYPNTEKDIEDNWNEIRENLQKI